MFSAAQNMAVSLGNRGMAVSGLEGFDGSDSPCRGTPRGASSSVGVGAVSGLKMGGFGGGCNSPQVRVPASASGQGTVAVGSPNPRAVSKQNSFLRAHPAANNESVGAGVQLTTSRPALNAKSVGTMKRKRPPALSISNDICTHSAGHKMSLATERDLVDAGAAEEVVAEGQTFALNSKRGKRRLSSEDAYQAAPGLNGDPTQGIFSVFDGHGGRAAADFAAANLHDAILEEVNGVSKSPRRAWLEGEDQDPEVVEEVKAAMIRGFLATDKRFLSECHLKGGATATTAFLCAGRIWVANVGDCRAVMCEGGEAVALTHDHRPDRAEERKAVEGRGGEVVSILGTSRVQGVLGVSRALGDRDLKQYITAEPDVYSGPISYRSEFLILGTDGLWDVVGNQEATDLVRSRLGLSGGDGGNSAGVEVAPVSSGCTDQEQRAFSGDVPELAVDAVRGSGSKGTDAACRGLVELARSRGSRDDISVLIVELGSYAQGATPASTPVDDPLDGPAVAFQSPGGSTGSPKMRTPPETSPSRS